MTHPLPKGTRVVVNHPGKSAGIFRILNASRSHSYAGHWRYTLVGEEYYPGGIMYYQAGCDIGERNVKFGCWDEDLTLCCDLPRKPTAEEMYEVLRSHD